MQTVAVAAICNLFCVSRVSMLVFGVSHPLQILLIETPLQLIADVPANRSKSKGVRGEKGSLGCENLLIPTFICLAGSPGELAVQLGIFLLRQGFRRW